MQLTTRSPLVLLTALGAALLAWWIVAFAHATDPAALPAPAPTERSGRDDGPLVVTADESGRSSADWVGALQRTEVVQFVVGERPVSAVDPADGQIVAPLPPPLDAAEKARLAFVFRMGAGSCATRLTQLQSKMDPADEDDLLSEAGAAEARETYQAAACATENDDYVIVRKGSPYPTAIPDGKVIRNNFAKHDGEDVDVVFYLRFADYPALGNAVHRCRQMERFWRECKVAEFNARPFAERVEAVQDHDRVPALLREGPPADLETWEERENWKNRLMRRRLPDGLIVDRNTFLARSAGS